MKAERTLTDIQNMLTMQIIPAQNIQIKKIATLKDLKELKSRLPFLKRAVLSG
jgi:hypothetical protein